MPSNPGINLREKLNLSEKDLEVIRKKTLAGGEIENSDQFEDWVKSRFLPNCVKIENEDYAQVCVSALKILPSVAATDYGSSRQRDMGQLWADMIRGYLGEIAVKIFIKNNWKVEVFLDHEKGSLQDYLPMDIHEVLLPNGQRQTPKIKISIKATKWNGIWLDIPGDQFNHSDIHILVKVGVGRDHLFAFFKEISVFKDKILPVGEKIGALTHSDSETLFNELPSFQPIPAYIFGFIRKNDAFKKLPYEGKKGRKNYNITGWKGPISPGDLDEIKKREKAPGKIEFEGIRKFSHNQGYLFNAGNLLWGKKDWDEVIEEIKSF